MYYVIVNITVMAVFVSNLPITDDWNGCGRNTFIMDIFSEEF